MRRVRAYVVVLVAILVAVALHTVFTARSVVDADLQSSATAPQASAVACMSGSFDCIVAGTDPGTETATLTSVIDGAPSAPDPVAGVTAFGGAACAGRVCIAVGSIMTASGLEGATVALAPGDSALPAVVPAPGTEHLDAIACSARRCTAVGQGSRADGFPGAVVQTLGTDGTVVAPPVAVSGAEELRGVGCAADAACLAVGRDADGAAGVLVPIIAGAPGRPVDVPSAAELAGVSCAPASLCVAVGVAPKGAGVVVRVDVAGHLGGVDRPTGAGALDAVGCASGPACLAAGQGGAGAGSPIVVSVPLAAVRPARVAPGAGDRPRSGVTCPVSTGCVVAGTAPGGVTLGFFGPGGNPMAPPAAPSPCRAAPATPAPAGPVERLAGASRDATSVAISRAAFPTGGSAGAVVVASGATFPDALAGTPLAVARHGPLLLTAPDGLTPAVDAEIRRVLPTGGTVYLLGGRSALSAATDEQVRAIGDTPVRISGADRFATAVAVADELGDPTAVYEATGTDFPDALAAGAAAAAHRGAVLLTAGSDQAPETAAYLAAHPDTGATAVGGPAADADPTALTDIIGAGRYETAVDVAESVFPRGRPIGFASGTDFPDALAGGAEVAAHGGPVLLVLPCGPLPLPVSQLLAGRCAAPGSHVYGGTSAVGDDVLGELERTVKPACT